VTQELALVLVGHFHGTAFPHPQARFKGGNKNMWRKMAMKTAGNIRKLMKHRGNMEKKLDSPPAQSIQSNYVKLYNTLQMCKHSLTLW
jgi:hypothetical protein